MSEIIVGDCLEVMADMADDSMDCVITSPPYNMNLRIRNGIYTSRQIVKELSTKYKGYDDNLPMDEYLVFNRKVLKELLRLSPLVFYNVQFLTGNKVALFKLIGEFAEQLKEVIIWDKINAEPAIGGGVMNSRYEVVLVFDTNNAISRKFDTAQFERGTLQNLWQIKRGKKITNTHGAVFPEELVGRIITNFTSERATILDPFLGTGTTAKVAKGLGRNYIGIEMNPDYVKIAQDRLKQGVLL
jgi:site-specific DNA-methyltransferase (adenine-specific)